jgi:pro-sigmaK processing inhibitor BofA
LIFVFNLIGSNFDVIMPLNIFTAFIVGVLGLPGAVLLLIFNVI